MESAISQLDCDGFDQHHTLYCFGDLSGPERDEFELHLLDCDDCRFEVQRLNEAVRELRTAPIAASSHRLTEVVGGMGISGDLHRAFAGHLPYAVTAAGLYSLLFAVPVVVEVAYEFDRFGRVASWLATAAFVWISLATLLSLAIGVRRVRAGGGGIVSSIAIQLAATVLLSAVVFILLPSEPTVRASFGTWPANLGYLKSVFYAWLVGPIFVFWPFLFVTAMQRALAAGHYRQVISVLTDQPLAVAPRGVPYPRSWFLVTYLGALLVTSYVGVNHLFGALQPGEFKNLFMGLVVVRAGVWAALPAICVWWYRSALSELLREAVALRLLDERVGLGRQD